MARWTFNEAQFFIACDQVLFRLVKKFKTEQLDDIEYFFCLAIPSSLLPVLLQAVHGNVMTAHLSATRMLSYFRPRFWSRHLAQKTQDFVKSCVNCIACSKNTIKHGISSSVLGSWQPMCHISWDCMTLPKSDSGMVGILTITDRSTRFLTAWPIRDFTARTCAQCLSSFFIRYGIPKSCKSDRGSAMLSATYTILASQLGVDLVYSNARSPWSTSAEPYHRTISASLRHCILDGYKSGRWDEILFAIVQGINESSHVYGTTVSPFYLLHGWTKRTCIDHMIPHELASRDDFFETWNDRVRHMSRVRQLFHNNWAEKASTDKNLRILPEQDNYQPGDQVILFTNSGKWVIPSSRKLSVQYDGSYTILHLIGNHSCVLQRNGDNTILQTPVSLALLKKIPKRPADLMPRTTLAESALNRMQKLYKKTLN